MNRKQRILTEYRLLVIEIETLERQSKFLTRYIGGPQPVRSPVLTGMPRGTNDPEAAMLQREDTENENEPAQLLEEKAEKLRQSVKEFEKIVNAIKIKRLQIIIRNYYALGLSDERIAEQMDISRSTVNKCRTDYFNSLR